MREIKFRAWDTIKKAMCEVNLIDFIGNIALLQYSGTFPKSLNIIELMQYTGLKDKNGVEIYEGDIVRRTDNSEIGEVIFVNGCFVFKNIEFEYLISLAEINHNDYGDFVEVIGNIYENPELLKD